MSRVSSFAAGSRIRSLVGRRFPGREVASRLSLQVASAVSRFLGVPPVPNTFGVRILGGALRGGKLYMPDSQVGAGFLFGIFEPWVVDAMRAHVRPGGVAYDIGASYGYHALQLAKLVGPSGRVLAFEPHPRDNGLLVRNARANNAANIEPLAVAVSDAPGTVSFAVFSYPGVSHIQRDSTPADANLLEVKATSLDSLVFSEGQPAPAFIKMDIEGGEPAVLRGATRVLREVRPVIVCEVGPESRAEVSALAEAAGYTVSVLHDGGGGFADVLLLPPLGPGTNG
jgi:FkbM family methyltransferase